MSLKTAWAQVFGVAAILAAALAFAPSAAQAHAGHIHKSIAVATPVEMPAPVVAVVQASVQTDHAVDEKASHDQNVAELRTAPDVIPAVERGVCGQGCCTGAPCQSCTACTLGPDVVFLLPHDAGESLVVWNVAGSAGCDPEGLRKPPRSFA